jgi:F-type H+-transporting ATPase subunit epsilon
MKHLSVKIVTPQSVVVSEEYISASIPTVTGELTILPNHLPLVGKIKAGEIVLRREDGESRLSVSSGILEVRPESHLVILADDALRAENIDVERAEEAKKRVEKLLLEKKNEKDVDYAKLQGFLEKEMARIKVGKKYRR